MYRWPVEHRIWVSRAENGRLARECKIVSRAKYRGQSGKRIEVRRAKLQGSIEQITGVSRLENRGYQGR